MKTTKKILGISLLLLSFIFSNNIIGQNRTSSGNRGIKTERTSKKNRVESNHHRNDDRYRTQPIRRNPNYRYPRHRHIVRSLPRYHVRLVYGGLSYFYYSGIYYTMYGDEYIIVIPPRGFRITVLPVGYIRVVSGPSVYFYHSGIYYTESTTTSNESEGKYEVTQPPIGVVLNEIHEDSQEVVIDGKVFYEYNSILYKKKTDSQGNTSYEVVYSNTTNN